MFFNCVSCHDIFLLFKEVYVRNFHDVNGLLFDGIYVLLHYCMLNFQDLLYTIQCLRKYFSL